MSLNLQVVNITLPFQSIATWRLLSTSSVQPKNQKELVDVWKEFVKEVVEKQRGIISANLHRSFDGTRLVNYAHWKTKEDQARMIEGSVAQSWRDDFIRIADVTPNFYCVVYMSN